MLERIAREKVDNHILFSKASETLRERAAESIATRRTRFSYLEQHKEKVSTLIKPVPKLQQIENKPVPEIQEDEQPTIGVSPSHQDNREQKSEIQPSSYTVSPELDQTEPHVPPQNDMKRTESVMSAKVSSDQEFPSIPELVNGRTSFSCPFCLLECPAKEASDQKQWR